MTIGRPIFFVEFGHSFGHFVSLERQAAMNQVLDFLERDAMVRDVQWAAYMLATIHHETARTWEPIEEYGHGAGHPYGHPVTLTTGRSVVYYGRGYVQLTWLGNYARMGQLLGVDLVNYPERALEPHVAWQVLSYGMRLGCFTGRRLSDYIAGERADYRGARAIVNGHDQADLIRGYAVQLEEILRRSVAAPAA